MSRKFFITLITTLLSLALLSFSVFELYKLYNGTRLRQQYVSDLAYANNIRFGLFSVEQWKKALSDIIVKKVDELDFDRNMHQTMQKQIEKALYELIGQIEKFLNQDKRQGNWLTQAFKSVAYTMVFDAEQFKKQVPHWAGEVVKSISSESNKAELKSFILQKFNEFMDQTTSPEKINIREVLSQKYGFENYDECVAWIENEDIELRKAAWMSTWLIIIGIIVLFSIYFLTPIASRNVVHFYTGLLGVMALLAGGLLTPMIDIDARISEVNFELLGETILFKNQVLFFESKSIFDVVRILIEQGNVQTAAVGALIFTFSIIFPALKIIVSALSYPFPRAINKYSVVRFFALKSGKWSMADVMVVAIFMSYIGFRSLIGAQLDSLGNVRGFNMLSTHEHTTLQMGFFLFTAFCFSGMVFAYYVANWMKEKELEA